MCFVLGVNFIDSAMTIANRLSLCTVMQKSGVGRCNGKMQLISFVKFLIGIASRNACERTMYSASAVDSAISVYSLLHHMIGQFA